MFSGRFERCFRGSEGVAALLSLRFCRSAEEAVRFGNDLVEYGYIVSVKGVGHRFKNKPASLYRFWRDGGAGKTGEVAVPGPSPTGAQVTRLHADSMSMASTTGGSVHSYSEHEEDPAGSDRHIRDFTPDKTRGTPPSKRAVDSPAGISIAGIAQMHSRRSIPTSPRSSAPAPSVVAAAPAPAAAAAPSHPAARPPTSSSSRSTPQGSLRGSTQPFKPRSAAQGLGGTPLADTSHIKQQQQQQLQRDMHSITPPPSLHIPRPVHDNGGQRGGGGGATAHAALPGHDASAVKPTARPSAEEPAVAEFDLSTLSNQLIDVHEQLLRLNAGPLNAPEGLGGALLRYCKEELLSGQVQPEQQDHSGSAAIFFMVFKLFLVIVLLLAAACGALALPLVAMAGRMQGVEGCIVTLVTLLPPFWLAFAFSNSQTLRAFRLQHMSAPAAPAHSAPAPTPAAAQVAAAPAQASSELPVLDMQQVVQQARNASAVRRRNVATQ